MARPKKIINQKQFEALCGLSCTVEDICSVLEISKKTLFRWCEETYNASFSTIYSQKVGLLKASIRKQQVDLAKSGNPSMNIWLGKNLLKQSDNPFQDEIKLKELELKQKEMELKQREFELKEKLLLKQLEGNGSNQEDLAKAIIEVFGVVANGNNKETN